MLFQILLNILSFMMGMTVKRNKSLRYLITPRNLVYVMVTEDGKRGRRFIFRNGIYSTDKVFNTYDLAFVWKDASIAFKALALGGETGLQDAINNWDLKLMGNSQLANYFAIILMTSLGKMKR